MILGQVLLYAQLRGNNQGLLKLVAGALPRKPEAAAQPAVERETRLSTLLDGQQAFGMLVMQQLLNSAVEKASASGFAIVGNHGSSSSTGALGYWAEQV